VYLPKTTAWYNFWTGARYNGGQTVKVDAPLDIIPVFVKAGAIVPMGKFIQFINEKQADTLEIRIYTGADGKFDLYEDEGTNYNYENGAYSIISFEWNEKDQILTIEKRQGDFEGILEERFFNIVWVNESNGTGIEKGCADITVKYSGGKIEIEK
jgi:alpha-D-xyloside xylohydrolase